MSGWCILKTSKPKADCPVLLLLDNHYTNISLRSYTFCKEHRIVVLSLPPHKLHRLQPLDVTFFGLRKALNREYDFYLKNYLYQKITPDDIALIFTKAYFKMATMEKEYQESRAVDFSYKSRKVQCRLFYRRSSS